MHTTARNIVSVSVATLRIYSSLVLPESLLHLAVYLSTNAQKAATVNLSNSETHVTGKANAFNVVFVIIPSQDGKC